MVIVYETLPEFITLFLTVAVPVIIVYSITSFFLNEAFIYQLTNILFIVALMYALAYVFSFEKKLLEMEEGRKELLGYLEEIKDIKEIKKKPGLK